MCQSHKKALQLPHPSEPIYGVFRNPPACRRCVPIYPLRYGIADSAFDRTALPHLNIQGYPALKGGKHYGLRVLRPGSYVYLFYFKDERMWTQHYQVTDNGRFAALWWSEKDREAQTPGQHVRPHITGATNYIPAPETSIAKTVWLMVSDTLLSHCTLWQIETDQHGLRSKLATKINPSAGPAQPHALPAAQLGTHVAELMVQPSPYTIPQPLITKPVLMHWSESQPGPSTGAHIKKDMVAARLPYADIDIEPLAVVIQDPIGITSELNQLATLA
ncbi:MAG: hypothetical protein P4L87_07845, partial [Formivibrio sp.]|nr:hypothetical protein [Formivibrio sp.]